jgi:hypothetical protein
MNQKNFFDRLPVPYPILLRRIFLFQSGFATFDSPKS